MQRNKAEKQTTERGVGTAFGNLVSVAKFVLVQSNQRLNTSSASLFFTELSDIEAKNTLTVLAFEGLIREECRHVILLL